MMQARICLWAVAARASWAEANVTVGTTLLVYDLARIDPAIRRQLLAYKHQHVVGEQQNTLATSLGNSNVRRWRRRGLGGL